MMTTKQESYSTHAEQDFHLVRSRYIEERETNGYSEDEAIDRVTEWFGEMAENGYPRYGFVRRKRSVRQATVRQWVRGRRPRKPPAPDLLDPTPEPEPEPKPKLDPSRIASGPIPAGAYPFIPVAVTEAFIEIRDRLDRIEETLAALAEAWR